MRRVGRSVYPSLSLSLPPIRFLSLPPFRSLSLPLLLSPTQTRSCFFHTLLWPSPGLLSSLASLTCSAPASRMRPSWSCTCGKSSRSISLGRCCGCECWPPGPPAAAAPPAAAEAPAAGCWELLLGAPEAALGPAAAAAADDDGGARATEEGGPRLLVPGRCCCCAWGCCLVSVSAGNLDREMNISNASSLETCLLSGWEKP